ncbi:unnamed protein product [Lactuca virosa]|uniref:Secreted protein n=1 Tax=Lactuca virosa TaxID=75947 RepID=A0AAU9P1K6_9ASTR|nr:unnamed protein product [Lactuca virosa]
MITMTISEKPLRLFLSFSAICFRLLTTTGQSFNIVPRCFFPFWNIFKRLEFGTTHLKQNQMLALVEILREESMS